MNSSSELISIMMPAFNAEKYIASAIQSIVNQSYPEWELIVVNDGSTDRTAQIVEKFTDSRIHVIHQENQGEAVARNTAMAAMNGQYIAFLDSDDQFQPEFLQKMITYLQENPHSTACYCDGFYMDIEGSLSESLQSQRRGPFDGNLLEPFIRASDVIGPPICTLLQRQLVQENQLRFDPRIVIGPDWDFFTRLSRFASWGYVDFQGVNYRVHQTNISTTTTSRKRRASLAICRENAIILPEFDHLTLPTRDYVFYDLLINLLYDQPEHQQQWLQSQQFKVLPDKNQALLLRLAAAKSIALGNDLNYAKAWIHNSRVLNSMDIKAIFIELLLRIAPNLAQKVLLNRYESVQSNSNSPFNLPD